MHYEYWYRVFRIFKGKTKEANAQKLKAFENHYKSVAGPNGPFRNCQS